jgi:hypothetical protein
MPVLTEQVSCALKMLSSIFLILSAKISQIPYKLTTSLSVYKQIDTLQAP